MDSSWVLYTHLVFDLEGSQKPLLTVQAVGLWGCSRREQQAAGRPQGEPTGFWTLTA